MGESKNEPVSAALAAELAKLPSLDEDELFRIWRVQIGRSVPNYRHQMEWSAVLRSRQKCAGSIEGGRPMTKAPLPHAARCAIYTRVSTDQGLEQDFNSLDAQREACSAYIKSQAQEGWKLIS